MKKTIASTGMTALGELDQAKALTMTGLKLPGAHTFFVGNPTTGKMFFQADPAVGVAVPFRMYVWQDQQGKTQVSYLDPAPLFTALSPNLAAGGQKVAMAVATVAKSATA